MGNLTFQTLTQQQLIIIIALTQNSPQILSALMCVIYQSVFTCFHSFFALKKIEKMLNLFKYHKNFI